jgi:hypothetical protein
MARFVRPVVHQVCSEARVGDVVDCSVYKVSQTGFRVEDIEVVVPDLLVIVKVWLELGASMEGEAIDGAVCHRYYSGLDSPMVNTRNSMKVTMRKASIYLYALSEWSDKSNKGQQSTPDFDL